jgi:signal transduction histidine kinase/AraC-like DNA-binding protein/ActR/RegA family two-component response regulator
MLGHIITTVDGWASRWVSLPGDKEESFYQKKTYLLGLFALLSMVVFLTLATWWLELATLTRYGAALLVFFVVQIFLFVRLRRGLKWFIFVSNTFNILLSFFVILALGGITYSAGLIFVGMACVVYTMIYPSARLLWWSFSMYVGTLALSAVLHPFLTPDPELTPEKNLFFFVLNSLWLSANILILIFYVYRKQAELAELKAQRLREIDDLKTRMFANIAHEFRTPLTLIGGMAELLQEDPSHQHQERTEVIQRNANKVLRLVDQMLNLARLEAGALPFRPVQGDVTAFLRFVFNNFQGLAEHRRVRLHFLPETQGFFMDFDPEKLEELVGNLLSNALKYTPAGGDVYFSFHINTGAKEQLVIKVRDTGIGIPAEKLGYIFDRFFRVENTEKHYEEGSGIGLTLVREYVKLMNGDIGVVSKPGEGTDFSVTLPVTRSAQLKDNLQTNLSPGIIEPVDLKMFATTTGENGHPLLLLIEDNPELSQYIQLVLGQKFRLLSAADGKEGIRLAIEQVPDLVLSDVMMPGMDGFEVCRTLKKDFRTSHIPIVLLTARADTASRITGLEQGSDAYLTKPFNKRELLACLRNLYNQREKLRIRYSLHPDHPVHDPTPGPDGIFMKNVFAILEKNYPDEGFGSEDFCKAMNLSRVQLYRKLMALTGQPASHFLRSFRLEKAKELLCTTTKSVSEIAYETGFSDANYFSRIFAQEFGTPPTGLRKGTADKV